MAISDRLPRLSQKKALVGTLALVSGAALVVLPIDKSIELIGNASFAATFLSYAQSDIIRLRLIAIASLCMFGIVGQVVTDVPAAMQRRPAQTLADALPNVATWWVPEHPISFGLVIGLGVLGFFLSIKGKRLDRYLNA